MKRITFVLSVLVISFLSFSSCEDDNVNPNDETNNNNNNQTTDSIYLGTVWHFYGDSQTAGRAEESSVVSHAVAFENIWTASYSEVESHVDGVGGCTIQNSKDRYLSDNNLAIISFIHFQESGDQHKTGQQTAEEFAASFEEFVRTIIANSPNAVISTETAYSFGREDVDYRDWGPYNEALKAKVSELESENIMVYVAEVDKYIKLLVDELGFENVITDDGGHYRGVGNLLVALAIYKSLGYNIEKLDLSNIPDSEINQSQKELCISIVNENNS